MVHLSRLLGFSLLATLALPGPTLTAAALPRLLAQTVPTFTVPDTIPNEANLRIDGSPSLSTVNRALEDQFERRYNGAQVALSTNGSTQAIQDVLAGEIDLAALGRPLTAEERDQGLVAVPVGREKIAIIVGPDNSLSETLSFAQFAQIFRGEIKDWSEIGGAPGPIRFVDRPEDSDTRQAFRNYPGFREAPFEVGSTASPVAVDDTAAVIKALGRDGMGFAIASQVLNNDAVKIVSMHLTLPDDPRYPFSQPLYYVYKGEPTVAVQAFLGLANSPEGQAAIAAAQANPDTVAPETVAPESVDESVTETATPETSAPDTVANSESVSPETAKPISDGIVAVSPDGNIVAQQAAEAGTVALISPTGELLSTITGLDGAATALAFSPDSQTLAVGLENGTVQYWGVDGDALSEPFAVADGAMDLAFVEDGTALQVTTATAPEGTASSTQFDLQGQPLADAPSHTGVPFWFWLLPLALLGLLLWALLHGRDSALKDVVEPVPFDVDDTEPDEPLSDTLEPLTFEKGETNIVGDSVQERSANRLRADSPATPPANLPVTPPANLPVNPLANPSVAPAAATLAAGLAGGAVATAVAANHRKSKSKPQTTPPNGHKGAHSALSAKDSVNVSPEIATPTSPKIVSSEPLVPPTSVLENNSPAMAMAGGVAVGAAALRGRQMEMPSTHQSSGEPIDEQSQVEATKFDMGGQPSSPLADRQVLDMATLASVDEGLPDLPDGYGESRIVLMPRDPKWAYAYWDVSNEHREALRNQGGQTLALRLYDVTDIDVAVQSPHSLQQFDCDEMARTWYVPVPVSDRDYMIEIGYLTADEQWLTLARSVPIHIPPVYPSDWIDDQFVTLDWAGDLQGKTLLTFQKPGADVATTTGEHPVHDAIFAKLQNADAMRVAGSLFGSMQQVPQEALSSYIFPSGVGMWTLPTASGNASGLTQSGLGSSASAPPLRPRKFWLVADAELIVYGATDPDATVTIGGKKIALNPDGTFRYQMSFQDGVIEYPIVAVASDGEQQRSIHMTFERETPERNTNTKEDAGEEWF